MEKQEIYIIAEIGGTHIGDMDRAKKLIRLAKESNANCVKLQKRCIEECCKKEVLDAPHQNTMFAYGDKKTYRSHREALELSTGQHAELKEYCESIGIDYSTSVWDLTSAKEIIELNPKFIKIPSACNNNIELIDYLYNEYSGDVHISLGMCTRNEALGIITKYGINRKYNKRTVFYHCVSGYPVPFDQTYLLEIAHLEEYGDSFGFGVGFSNHGYGIALEPAAYALGARYFERHFIDDRMFPHTDAAPSLEPSGLAKLVRDLHAVEKALTYRPKQLEQIELEQRNKLRSD